MSKLEDILNAIDVYDDTHISEEEVDKAKQQIKELMLDLMDNTHKLMRSWSLNDFDSALRQKIEEL